MKENEILLVNSSVLPDVFLKVVEAKKLLTSGTVRNATETAKAVGISRSAFYKYKDNIFLYNTSESSRTVELHAVLTDKAGVFSAFTTALYKNGANIITVNQEKPNNGTAVVTIAISVDSQTVSVDDIIKKIRNVDGILSIEK